MFIKHLNIFIQAFTKHNEALNKNNFAIDNHKTNK